MYIDKLVQILESGRHIVFFGGAGVSTASGIPDFRSSDGLFNQQLGRHFTPEQLISHSFFLKYPKEFFEFYKNNLIYPKAIPNRCHLALAKLEHMNKLDAVITQNIDGLHQAAGSTTVYELHGSVHRNFCTNCEKKYPLEYILKSTGTPICDMCGSIIKPDVVLYEEALNDKILSNAIHAITQADTLIIGGTSLIVYPATGLIRYFNGKNLVLINKTPTPADSHADLVINESIDAVLGDAVDILQKKL